MANEDLVIEIQNGNKELLITLWEQNQGFIRDRAHSWKNAFSEISYFDEEDLMQSAWLALPSAVKYYNPDLGCKFISVFLWFIKKEFLSTIGLRSSKRDALLFATTSLDSPIMVDNPDGETIGDLLPDPDSIKAFEEVEAEMEQERIRLILNEVASELLNDNQWVVYQSLLDELRYSDMYVNNPDTYTRISPCKADVFRVLRNDPRTLQLWLDVTERHEKKVSEIIDDCMKYVGVNYFREAGASSVEKAVLRIISNEGVQRGKAQSLERQLSEKLHNAGRLLKEEKKYQKKRVIISELANYEHERLIRIAQSPTIK